MERVGKGQVLKYEFLLPTSLLHVKKIRCPDGRASSGLAERYGVTHSGVALLGGVNSEEYEHKNARALSIFTNPCVGGLQHERLPADHRPCHTGP